MAERALALVVRGTDWSETSRIVTLFTREFGKVRGLAKGGRRLRSNFEFGFDLLTLCRIVFLKKAHGGLDLLTEAQVAEKFAHLRTDLGALNAGYYLAELLSDGTQDYDPHPALFDAAVDALRKFADPEHRQNALATFELVWLRELGYSPRFETCAACTRDLSARTDTAFRVDFSPEAGGAVCPDCQAGLRDRRPLSEAARQTLIRLDPAKPASADRPSIGREVRGLLGLMVSSVLGRRPRLLAAIEADASG